MGILVAVLGIVLIFDSETCMLENILCGLCMASVVLCNPYAIVLIVAMAICVIMEWGAQKDKSPRRRCLKKVIGILIGGSTLLALFLYFVFSKADINMLLQNLPFILNDSEHSESLMDKFGSFFFIIRHLLPKTSKWYLMSLPVLTIAKKMTTHTNYWSLIKRTVYCIIPVLAVYDTFYIETYYGVASINIWMHCIFRYGFLFQIMKENYDIKQMLQVALGYLYSIGVYLCSNTSGLTYTAALVVPCFFLFSDIKNETEKFCRKVIAGLMGGLLIFNVCFYNWGEEDTTCCNRRIYEGPAYMLYVSEEMEEKYYSFIQVANELEISQDNYLLCKEMNPIMYMYTNCRVGCYSTFAFSLDYSKLKEYFRLHPQKIPSIVYFANEKLTAADDRLITELLSAGYEKKEISTRFAYVRNYSDI